ncbi:MAG: hypothetical protein ABR549_17235 [Mycobacteriales bacterium]
MKHALNDPPTTNLPPVAPNGLTAGLDWAKDDHVVCVVDSTGPARCRWQVDTGLLMPRRRASRLKHRAPPAGSQRHV